MAILVTGGAGYIGSVTVERLRSEGRDVVVLDDLYRGHRAAVEPGVPFYQGLIGDKSVLETIFKKHKIDSCIHFAALTAIGESVSDPAKYFENNVAQGIAFVEALTRLGLRKIVFSSTCATYGDPDRIPIDEACSQKPLNPYGWSKLMMEKILASFDLAHGLRFVALRYFNAAGATKAHGEHHEPESHLIPNVLFAASGKIPVLPIFGNDYKTPDGTAIRDYVHVWDLADAHVRAIDYLANGAESQYLNVGTGRGHSVLETIECARKITKREIKVRFGPRRAGDAVELVADAKKIQSVLGWTAKVSDMPSILSSQWEWAQRYPQGYPK